MKRFSMVPLVPVLIGLVGCERPKKDSAAQASGKPAEVKKVEVASGQKYKIGIVTNNSADFWTLCEAGARKAEAELKDVELIFKRPEKGDEQSQNQLIESLLEQDLAGLGVSVNDPEGQVRLLNRVTEKVNLIAMDNDAPKSKRIAYIGTDNYEAGKAVGRLVKEAMPNGGKFAIFVGKSEPDNARRRYQGVVDELAGQKDAKGPQFGSYTMEGTIYTDGVDVGKAKANAEAVLEKFAKEIDDGKPVALVGLWAYNAPAALKAAREKGRVGKVVIVSFDEDAVTLDGIEKGEIYGTVVQDPFGFGYETTKVLRALAVGDRSMLPADGMKYVPYRVVTKSGGMDPFTKAERLTAGKLAAEIQTLLGK